MNNRGLTLVELIVTFAHAIGIVIILLNVLVIIKNNYNETDIKTKLVVNQSTLSNMLNSKFVGDNLVSRTSCPGTFCYSFEFKDGSTIDLKVDGDKISFGNYVYVLDSDSKVETPSLTFDDPYLVIKIPISTKLYPNEDFGINLVYEIE